MVLVDSDSDIAPDVCLMFDDVCHLVSPARPFRNLYLNFLRPKIERSHPQWWISACEGLLLGEVSY